MYEESADTFLYFAYGSNLLKRRIRINNASAEFIGIGRLEGHQLDFIKYSEHWRGASATIVPTEGAHVWGAIWRLHVYDMPALDKLDFIKYSSFWGGPTATLVPTANAHVWGVIWRVSREDIDKLNAQKGLEINKYYYKYLKVLTCYMGYFSVRVYIQRISPLPRGDNDPIPVEYWPSWTLKEIMIMGASEHGIPGYYIKQLKKLVDNGEEGALRTVCLLIRYARDDPCECRVPGRIPRQPLKLDLSLIHKGRKVLSAAKKSTVTSKLDRRKYEENEDTFLYYSYGSNMLKKRIRLNNPSAEFVGIGRLENYQLSFLLQSEKWRGAAATIVPAAGSHVWGALWRLHREDLPSLDKQEGVGTNRYYGKTIEVVTPEKYTVQCRVYQQTEDPPILKHFEELPEERRPSSTYIACIIKGAKECELPPYYIEILKKIPHNGQEALPEMIELLR